MLKSQVQRPPPLELPALNGRSLSPDDMRQLLRRSLSPSAAGMPNASAGMALPGAVGLPQPPSSGTALPAAAMTQPYSSSVGLPVSGGAQRGGSRGGGTDQLSSSAQQPSTAVVGPSSDAAQSASSRAQPGRSLAQHPSCGDAQAASGSAAPSSVPQPAGRSMPVPLAAPAAGMSQPPGSMVQSASSGQPQPPRVTSQPSGSMAQPGSSAASPRSSMSQPFGDTPQCSGGMPVPSSSVQQTAGISVSRLSDSLPQQPSRVGLPASGQDAPGSMAAPSSSAALPSGGMAQHGGRHDSPGSMAQPSSGLAPGAAMEALHVRTPEARADLLAGQAAAAAAAAAPAAQAAQPQHVPQQPSTPPSNSAQDRVQPHDRALLAAAAAQVGPPSLWLCQVCGPATSEKLCCRRCLGQHHNLCGNFLQAACAARAPSCGTSLRALFVSACHNALATAERHLLASLELQLSHDSSKLLHAASDPPEPGVALPVFSLADLRYTSGRARRRRRRCRGRTSGR